MACTRVLGALAAAGLLLITGGLPALADPIPHDVVVTITDSGFSPGSVVIQAGGSVTWQNRGLNVHTATSLGGAPQQFNTGGFNGNQNVSLTFMTPGVYSYSSATDCLNGNNMPGFVCGVYSVTVVAPGSSAPATPVPPDVPPTPQATAVPTPQPTVNVTISDAGVSPPVVSVLLGGNVTWTNTGSEVHTATTTSSDVPLPFDSGGLAPGQSSVMTFPLAGTYTYTSAPDCQQGAGNPPGFSCGPYTVVVQGPK